MTKVDAPSRPVCGIVMPISKYDDVHDAAHWAKVLEILEEAAAQSGCKHQAVWENCDVEIIQSKILRNIFENDVVICDLSTRNPNVMLEFGMRLTTKKPTIVVAESGTLLPFDTQVIHAEFYPSNLEYKGISAFIEKVAGKIRTFLAAVEEGSYQSFLETFHFERVQPGTVTLTETEALERKLDTVAGRLALLESNADSNFGVLPSSSGRKKYRSPVISDDEYQSLINRVQDHHICVDDMVEHAKFGVGTVTEVVGNRIEADFEGYGSKRVLASFVTLLGGGSLFDSPPID